MYIRHTTMDELDSVCQIYADAQKFMQQNGNSEQWGNVHPPRDLIVCDIHAGKSFVCINDDSGNSEIAAVFYFAVENDPTYTKIDGQWLNSAPYGVVHRIARSPNGKGAGAFCLNWCYEQHQNVRIDTHKDNATMISLLNRLGYTYCGIIWIENGDKRLAFQKI